MWNPAQIQQQLQKAVALAQAGRMDEAWSLLVPLRAAIDHHGEALRFFALVAQNSGHADAAIDALKRIVLVENEPPEILGALADTLGRAGRHADAYEHWSRLVVKQPQAIDAHLNRAIAADNAGRFDDAVKAADEGLARQSGDPRLLNARAIALTHDDRMPEAIAAYERAVAADPNRALTRYNQAVTLRMACQFEEACAAYKEAERLGMKGAAFDSNWAAAELEAGLVDAAADRYRRALEAEPRQDEARKALTRLELEFRDGAAAFDHYDRAARQTNDPADWKEYQRALVVNKRFGEAGAIGREALSAVGEDLFILRSTLFAEGIVGDAAASLDAMDRLPVGLRDDEMGLIARAQLALRAHRARECVEHCLAYNAVQSTEQTGWSLLGLAWRMLADPREQWLCDYDRLVMTIDVNPVDGSTNAKVFSTSVAASLDPLHTTQSEPGDQSLRRGTQTSGDLFARLDPTIQQFRLAVLAAAQKAVSKLPEDHDHPFLRRKSKKLDIRGSWSVRLQGGGGHHVPHFHGDGWMSSAYYARLPSIRNPDSHEGWIEFGRAPDMYLLDFEPRR
ncbi:MAG: tetratricopeptide repeat protein, partial [Sphingomicrobium sp.]